MITEENIDYSEWIPQDYKDAYAHRYSRGDLSVNNREIRSIDTGLPIDDLHRMGLISDDHHQSAVFMITLHHVAFRSVGWSLMRDQAQSLGINPDSESLSPIFLYGRIMREMLPAHRHMVDRLCFQRVSKNDYAWIKHCRTTVHNSFDDLKKLIDQYTSSDNNGDITRGEVCPKSTLPQ